jgi:hypothetical protein
VLGGFFVRGLPFHKTSHNLWIVYTRYDPKICQEIPLFCDVYCRFLGFSSTDNQEGRSVREGSLALSCDPHYLSFLKPSQNKDSRMNIPAASGRGITSLGSHALRLDLAQ